MLELVILNPLYNKYNKYLKCNKMLKLLNLILVKIDHL